MPKIKNDRAIGIWLSHLDNIPVAYAAASVAYHMNPDPLFVTAATRTATRAWDLFVSPFIAEGFVYLSRRRAGEDYKIVPGLVKYQLSHAAAHLAEEMVDAPLTYLALESGLPAGAASAAVEGASVLAIQPALTYLSYKALDKAEGKYGNLLRKFIGKDKRD
jgi:heptaprenylglyceryl phosphate synthase